MTEQEQQIEEDEEIPEEGEQQAEEEPEADIDDADLADGADVFGDVDPETLDADLDEEGDDDPDDSEDVEESSDAGDAPTSPGDVGDVSLGHVYCRGLGVATALAVDRCSEDDDRDREEIIEEYSALAKQMEIDQYVDQAVAESGGIEQMSPGQAAVLMTGAMTVMVAVSEPAVTDAALDGLDLDAIPM